MPKQRISVREFRKTLKQHLDSGATVAIGNLWKVRAFLVSIPAYDQWSEKSFKRALRATAAEFRRALKDHTP